MRQSKQIFYNGWGIAIQQDCAYWADFELYRHGCHSVTMTFYKQSETWEGMVRIASDRRQDFSDSKPLPRPIVEKLSTLIGAAVYGC